MALLRLLALHTQSQPGHPWQLLGLSTALGLAALTGPCIPGLPCAWIPSAGNKATGVPLVDHVFFRDFQHTTVCSPRAGGWQECDRKALLEAVPGMLPISAYAQGIPVWIHTDPRGWRSRAGAGADPAPWTQHPHLSTAIPSLPTPSSPLFQEHPIREAAPGSGAGLAPAGRAGFGLPGCSSTTGCVQFTKDTAQAPAEVTATFPNTWTCPGSGLEQGQNRMKISCSWSKTQALSSYRGITRA